MDLSRLTRPAILCQCSRCSSSLAALENEWAKLSNSYSVVAGWLSVDLHRISISSEKKQIPQSSDMNLLRGRILQEVSCKLCQQKLGVLCAMENGPNIFWKLSKVAFREIVTMKTVEPLFKDGALERVMNPTPKEPRRDRTSIQPGALIPAGSTVVDGYDTSVSQQIQHQGLNIDHISSSVNNLHDTMSELKQSFTTLRIELNGPGRFSSEMWNPTGDFDMIATVLKELKLKSDEIEKLKLEMEALKLKNRYMEEQSMKQSGPMLGIEEALPEMHSPGLLHGSRKRPWPDSFPSGRTQPIADSFDDEGDIFDDFSLADAPVHPIKIPLKDPETVHSMADSTPGTPRPRIEVNLQQQQTPRVESRRNSIRDNSNTNSPQHAIVKRPRVSQPADRPPSSAGAEKKRPGRPRKSISQATKPDLSQTPKQTPLTEQTVNISGGSQKEHSSWNPSPNEQHANGPSRSRSLRSRSRPPSVPPENSRQSRHSDTNHPDQSTATSAENNGQEPLKGGGGAESTNPTNMDEKENPPQPPDTNTNTTTNSRHENAENNDLNEKRKARDYMARLAMQREEGMETEEAR